MCMYVKMTNCYVIVFCKCFTEFCYFLVLLLVLNFYLTFF